MPDFGSSTFTQSDAGNNTGTMPSWNGSAAPSTLDDAGRALQGAVTREWNWRNYTLTAGGTANTKTLTYSVAPQAYYNQRFAFIANAANTGTVTLNVNGLGAKAIKKDIWGTLTDLASGDMPTGVFVEVAFNTVADCFVWVNRGVVQSVSGVVGLQDALDAARMPAGALSPFAGATAPTGWLLCHGQAISRSSFAALFAILGTAYGAGDGSTTFNLPDLRDRVIAGKGDMGGTNAGRLSITLTGTTSAGSAVITGLSSTAGLAVGMLAIGPNIPAGRTIASIDSATQVTLDSGASVTLGTAGIRFAVIDSNTLGATGGAATHTLTTAQMPAHGHTVSFGSNTPGTIDTANQASEPLNPVNYSAGAANQRSSETVGGGQAHPNVQPTMVLNYIIKT
jgi:microcystin-dependent protein